MTRIYHSSSTINIIIWHIKYALGNNSIYITYYTNSFCSANEIKFKFKMESNTKSSHSLRERKKVEYYRKQPLYTVVNAMPGSRRRSKSNDAENRPRATGRRINRSKSVDIPSSKRENRHSVDQRQLAVPKVNKHQSKGQISMAAQRTTRSKSIDDRRRPNKITENDPVKCLAKSNAMLAAELVKMKSELDDKNKKIENLMQRNMANQKFINDMIKDGEEKQKQIDCLNEKLESAMNRSGKQHTTIFSHMNNYTCL